MLKHVSKQLMRTRVPTPKFFYTEPSAHRNCRNSSSAGDKAAGTQGQRAGHVEGKPKSVWEIPGIPILPLVGSWPFLLMNKGEQFSGSLMWFLLFFEKFPIHFSIYYLCLSPEILY